MSCRSEEAMTLFVNLLVIDVAPWATSFLALCLQCFDDIIFESVYIIDIYIYKLLVGICTVVIASWISLR